MNVVKSGQLTLKPTTQLGIYSDQIDYNPANQAIYDATSTIKIGNLMELPPVALICGFPQLEIEKYIIQRPFEDFHSGLGSQSLGVSREKLQTNLKTNDIPTEVLIPGLSNNLWNNGVRVNEANVMVTPGNSGDKVKSIPSSGSGHSFLSNNSNVNSGRPCASSRHSWSGLEPVAEENSWQQPDLNFKLARLSENGLTPENDLLVESNQSLICLSSKRNRQSTH
ncbi:Sister chromatid cohesion 1 protein 1 [Camellia lanceoleosa]|uniref:Sister chromatid cohesion 1 protein 1 n=1 Tax=Camellia lanceoleosa TaxID=1840588 RepID=A0ACC0GYR9_9ERIC|nr:Sister chromatid cohesion 1 protein 1 [Camellia lanceoleosa]